MRLCLTFFIFLILYPLGIIAQPQVNVIEKSRKINGINRTGLAIKLDIDKNNVKSDWKDQLKNYGNLNRSKGIYYVQEAMVPLLNHPHNVRIISIVEEVKDGKGTIVWYTIDMGDTYLTADTDSSKYKKAKKVLHDFGVMQIRKSINEEIEDAEDILEDKVDKQEDIIDEGEDLKSDMKWNRKEREKLEEKLKENKEEKEKLEEEIIENKKKEEKAAEEVRKIKKAIKRLRKKLSRVR